jgi:hypothetical protein
MRVAAIVLIVSGVSTCSVGCATAVEDTSAPFFVDGGRHGDTGGSADDVAAGNDTGGGGSDSATSAHDTGTSSDTSSTDFDTGVVDFDTGTVSFDSGTIGFDTGTTVVPDAITPPDAPPPPPSDGGKTCTTDAECTFPYNCCQILAGACGVLVGPLCFPLP